MKDLQQMILECIKIAKKQGLDQDFILTSEDGLRWKAGVSNQSKHVFLGEFEPLFAGLDNTPEDAVWNLIDLLHKNQANA